MKKAISLILAVAMCFSLTFTGAGAADEQQATDIKTWFAELYINFCEKFDSIFGDIDPTVKLNLRYDNKPVKLGTWLWDTPNAAGEYCDEYVSFLKENGVTEVYVFSEGIGWDVTADGVRKFVKKANAAGIKCAFLAGEYSWLDENDTYFDKVMEIYEDYQKNSAEDEKFYGIHMDLEPAQHPDYAKDDKAIMQKFAEFLVNKARPAADRNNCVLEWDVHRFLNDFTVTIEGEQINLLDCFMKYCDAVTLMSYSDEVKGVFKFTDEEIISAKKYGKCLSFGVETGTLCSDGESFAQEGKRAMVSALNQINRKLKKEFDYGEYGIAVHHVQSWYSLQSYPLPG